MALFLPTLEKPVSKKSEKLKQRLSLGPLSIGYSNEVVSKQKDVTFIVGKERFTAHIDVLVKVSPVFRSQFHGPFAKETVITLEDITPSAFKMFLKLVYEGTRSVSVLMTPKDSLDCMMLANRYLMDGLENFLRTKLLRNITYQNVFGILPYCNLNLDLMEMRSKCWSIIERDTSRCLKSQFFLGHVTWGLLFDILANSRITINEFELFQACQKWAENNKSPEYSTTKDVLGVAIYKIRFPLMTAGEFAIVKKTKLLNLGEIEDLEKNFRKNKTFSNAVRRNVCGCRKSHASCRLCSAVKNVSVKGTKAPTFPQTNVRLISSPRPRRCANFYRSPNQATTRTPVRMTTRSAVDVNGNNLRKGDNLSATTPTSSSSSSRSKITSEKNVLNCDCFKYGSCPSFPNGSTAGILRKLGYN